MKSGLSVGLGLLMLLLVVAAAAAGWYVGASFGKQLAAKVA